jgi:hypothetical protein
MTSEIHAAELVMVVSSRTPEGESNRCAICGAAVHLEPSWPLGDAPCPQCGNLLMFDEPAPVAPSSASTVAAGKWPVSAALAYSLEMPQASPRLRTTARKSLPAAGEAAEPGIARLASRFQIAWLIGVVFIALWILLFDRSFPAALTWEAVLIVHVLLVPRIVAWLARIESTNDAGMWSIMQLLFAFWGLLLGPLIGSTIGAVAAPFTNEGFAAWQGAWLGLILGSVLSMLVMSIVLPIVSALALWHLQRSWRNIPSA